jgi:hypothetical protein
MWAGIVYARQLANLRNLRFEIALCLRELRNIHFASVNKFVLFHFEFKVGTNSVVYCYFYSLGLWLLNAP